MGSKRILPIARKKRGPVARAWRRIWRYTVTGLLVWIPLIITIWVTWLFVDQVGLGIEKLIQNLLGRANIVGERTHFLVFLTKIRYVPGVGLLCALAVFFTTGFLMRYFIGRKLVSYGERLLNRIPFVSRLYRAVQQIRDVFITRGGTVFQRVCLIEYPRRGAYSIGFVTATQQSFIQATVRKKLHAVFVPTTPNPTSGYLLYLPPKDIVELDISVEDAMKLIISGGAFVPDSSPHSGEERLGQMVRHSLRDPDETADSE